MKYLLPRSKQISFQKSFALWQQRIEFKKKKIEQHKVTRKLCAGISVAAVKLINFASVNNDMRLCL